jgi:hypothetical protein
VPVHLVFEIVSSVPVISHNICFTIDVVALLPQFECNIPSTLRFLLHAILLEWNMCAYDAIVELQTIKEQLND